MTVNPDGSGHTNLTNTPTIGDGDENLSPDGMKIAFISNQLDRNFDLWIMNPDGSGRTPLYAARAVKSKVTLGTPRQNRLSRPPASQALPRWDDRVQRTHSQAVVIVTGQQTTRIGSGRWTILAAVMAALLASGCGGSGKDDDDENEQALDTDAAAQVSLQYYEALGAGDPDKACEYLTTRQHDAMARTEESLAGQEGRESEGCGAGLAYNFRPGPISNPQIEEATKFRGAVEVYLTQDGENGLRAQVVLEDGEWRVDEHGTATGPISTDPICLEPADERSDLPDPDPAWVTQFREGFHTDFSDDPVITTGRAYTQVLVDELEACGFSPETFEELVESVAAVGPSTLNAPQSFPFLATAGDQALLCKIVTAAGLTYKVLSCVSADVEN
jgi:hypothetical protein